ncbi:MAG: chromate transporter [Oscillospiraceae bacterium]|jgi:chromate transporter|nr:chromate transporter [Oscillospiraceae bacterium]
MIFILKLFIIFVKIGLFTIGGGLAMLPLMQQELVAQGLMTVQETIDMVAISHMTPGPFAVNAATFAGMKLYGVIGAAAATLGAVLPSFVICLLIAKQFFKIADNHNVKAALSGIRPVVYALILNGMVTIGGAAIFPNGFTASPDVPVLIIAAAAAALMWKTKFSPILIVLACGVFGAIALR